MPNNYLDGQQLSAIWNNIARDELAFFLEYESRGAWQRAKHLDLLCDKLERVERGEIKRLMVFLPPRHGKSEVGTKKFPAWFLGRNPDKEIIVTSYGADVAQDFSRIARDTLMEHGPGIFGVTVAQGSSSVTSWGLQSVERKPNDKIRKFRGGLKAAGAGGSLTGRGAHIAIIDDPFKGVEDSSSPTMRQKIYEWYKAVLWTRLAPGGAIILIMTRWHEDDLAGRLIEDMKNGGEQWDILKIPGVAIEGEPDALGREPGTGLWLERFGQEYYDQLRTTLGSAVFESLYQQNPRPSEGTIFKRAWFKNFYKQLPSRFDEVIQSWDCTFKDTSTSDYVSGTIWGRIGADIYLIDEIYEKMDLPATIAAIESATRRHPRAFVKLVEDKANGPAVIQMLGKKVPGLIPVNPEGGKIVRAQAITPFFEAGNVHLPDPSIAPWIDDYMEQLLSFPKGKHDDRVDSTSQALNRFNSVNEPRIR